MAKTRPLPRHTYQQQEEENRSVGFAATHAPPAAATARPVVPKPARAPIAARGTGYRAPSVMRRGR